MSKLLRLLVVPFAVSLGACATTLPKSSTKGVPYSDVKTDNISKIRQCLLPNASKYNAEISRNSENFKVVKRWYTLLSDIDECDTRSIDVYLSTERQRNLKASIGAIATGESSHCQLAKKEFETKINNTIVEIRKWQKEKPEYCVVQAAKAELDGIRADREIKLNSISKKYNELFEISSEDEK